MPEISPPPDAIFMNCYIGFNALLFPSADFGPIELKSCFPRDIGLKIVTRHVVAIKLKPNTCKKEKSAIIHLKYINNLLI